MLFHRGWKLTSKANEQSDEFDWRAALDKATGRESTNTVNMSLDEYRKKVSA